MFIRFDRIHEHDRHTDEQTDGSASVSSDLKALYKSVIIIIIIIITDRHACDDLGRACIASRGKNQRKVIIYCVIFFMNK